MRLGDYQAVSGGIKYFTVGEVSDNSITVKPYEFAVDVAYSRMLSEKFSAAVALRYMYSDLSGHYKDNVTAGSAFAADVSMYWNDYVTFGNRECNLAWGLNVSNIGSKINFGSDYSYFLPTNLRMGLNLTLPVNEYNRFAISAEANKLLVPATANVGSKVNSKRCNGAWEQNTPTTTSLPCAEATTTKAPCKATANTSPSAPVSK